MTEKMLELTEKINELERQRKQLEYEENSDFQNKAMFLIGKCFIANGKPVKILDVPQKTWDSQGHSNFNQYQFPALFLNYPNKNLLDEDEEIYFWDKSTLYIRDIYHIPYKEINKEKFIECYKQIEEKLYDEYINK